MLDGALALALPTRSGQRMQVRPGVDPDIIRWQSLDEKGNPWFEGRFESKTGKYQEGTNAEVGRRLSQMLREGLNESPKRRSIGASGWEVQTRLEFPRLWGLGSSSTLLYCLAQWLQIDAFKLSDKTLGGSGYDIACAAAKGPIYYLRNHPPKVQQAGFEPSFKNQLFFVYLGRKQDSREGIARYRERGQDRPELIAQISALSGTLTEAKDLPAFDECIRQHESIISDTLGLLRARDRFFSDYWGEIKSLGAWGGDFVLATSSRPMELTREYFNERGFEVFLKYDELILG